MGKIYKVKDKDGKIKYPVTVSDAVVVGDMTLTKKLEEYHNIKPLMAKTYTGLYYGANGSSNGYFEPICVKPKDTSKVIGEYYIKFKMSTTCEKYPNYKNFSIVELWFNRTGSINCSRIWNWRVGSYLHYYVGASYPNTNDDFNTIGTHLGVGIVSGNNYSNVNYKRDTLIEVFEISDDLVLTMDEPEDNKQYPLMSWYDANKITHNTYNAVDVGLQESGDSNTYDRTYLNGARFYVASDVRFHGYSLAFFDKEGKINPLSYCGTAYTATAYTKASGTRKYTTKGLVWEKGIMYYATSANNASGALLSTSSLYYTVPGVDLRYSDNCVANNVATNTLGTEDAKNIYLRGVIKEDGLFYIRLMDVTYNNNVYQKAWTQTPEDGVDEEGYRYVYWHLAFYYYNSSYPIRGYQSTLPIDNPMYIVENGELIEYNSYIHSKKQDTIEDLATIREGASKGATSLQVEDILDMETVSHASANYIPFGHTLLTNNPFTSTTKSQLYVSKINNRLYSANERFVVKHSYYNSEGNKEGDLNISLFDGNYEHYVTSKGEGKYAVLYIGKCEEEDLESCSTNLWTYGGGQILLSYYSTWQPNEITVEIYYKEDSSGKPRGWHSCTTTKLFGTVYSAKLPNRNNIIAIKITYDLKVYTSYCSALTQVEYYGTRSTISEESAVTKHPIIQNLYGELVVPKITKRGGTSAQFLKADGSVDSTTYTPQTSTGANTLLSTLPDWTANPTDTVKLIRRDTGGSASFGQVTFLTVWNYIKDKISSVLGLTSTQYGGNSATATKATQDGDGNVISSTYQKKESGKGLSTNDFTTTLKNKLDGIASGAEVNVQADWNETNTSSDAYIKNKPTIPSAVTESTVSGWGFTKNTGTYSKPSGGIPKTDLASGVQTSLNNADSALQVGDNVSDLVNDKKYIVSKTYSSTPLPSMQDAIMARVDALVRELLNGIGEGEGGSLTKYVVSDATRNTDEEGAYYVIPLTHKEALISNQPDVVILDNNILYKIYSATTEVHYASVSNQVAMSFRVASGSTSIIARIVDTTQHLTENQLKTINGESIVGSGDLTIDVSNAIKVVNLDDYVENGRFVCEGYFFVAYGAYITKEFVSEGRFRIDYLLSIDEEKFYVLLLASETVPDEWIWVGFLTSGERLFNREFEEVQSIEGGTFYDWKPYLDYLFPPSSSTEIDAYTKSEIDNMIGNVETLLASL